MKENYIIGNILIPIDFSERSLKAVDQTCGLAKKLNANITLYHSFSRPINSKSASAYEVEQLKKRTEESIEKRMSNIEESIPGLKECKYEFLAEPGISLLNIEKAFKKLDPDLMVLATHGVKGIELMWGSKTTNLIGSLKGPILVLPDGSSLGKVHKICLAYDFRKRDQNIYALSTLKQIAQTLNAHVRILDVRSKNYPKDDIRLNEEKKISLFLGEEVSHDFESIFSLDVEKAILDYVVEYEIGMVAVMPDEYNFLEKLFHRSLTELMAGELNVPLLTLRDK